MKAQIPQKQNPVFAFLLMTVLAAASLLCAPSALAAVITWGTPTYLAGDTDVSTSGTLVAAYSLNQGAATINGVAFANAQATFTSLTNATYGTNFLLTVFADHYALFGSNVSTFASLSTAYKTLMSNGVYGGSFSGGAIVAIPVITATNLTFGHQYLLQVWANDSRTGRAASDYSDLYSPDGNDVAMHYNSTGAAGGVGQWSTGTFIADGNAQPFSIIGNIASGQNADTYLNAVQIRDLGMAPGLGLGFWNGLAGNNVLDQTSLNFCTNVNTAPVGTAASLNTVLSLTNACYFYDAYYSSSSLVPVTSTNLTVAAGGVSLGSSSPGTFNFINSAVTYTLTSSDTKGITDGASPTTVYKSGNGTLILDGANSYSGGTIISLGTVQVGNGDANGSLGSGTVTDDASLVFDRNDNPTFTNVISGSGTVTQSGSGMLTLTGNNTYIGGTVVTSNGNNALSITGELNNGAYAGTIAIASNSVFNYNGGSNQTISGVISGAGALTQTGASTLILSGANAYTGGTTIGTGSTLQLNAAAGGGTGTIAIGPNGILTFNAATTFANAIASADSTAVINVNEPAGNTFLTGSLSGFAGTINCKTATTTGQLVINNANNAANPIGSSATWNIANGATLDLATPYTVNSASVILNGVGNNQAYGSLRLDACNQTGNVLLKGNALIGDDNTTGPSTISGIISDNNPGYGFTFVGTLAVNLVLTATNTYRGATVISNGTLSLGSATGSIYNSSGISLANGTTFDVSSYGGTSYFLGAGQTLATLGGSATINGNLDVTSGSPLLFQYNTANAPLNVTGGTLNLSNNPITITFTPTSGFAGGQVALVSGVSGTVSSSVVTFNQANASATPAPTLSISGGTLYLTINNPVITSYAPFTSTNLSIFGGTGNGIQGIPPAFSVTAVGSPTPTYQWYSNGVAIRAAGSPSYTYVTGTLPAGALTNSCVVQSSAGFATNTWILNVVSTNSLAPYPLAVLVSTNSSGTAVPPIAYWRLDESDMGGGNPGRPCNDWLGGNMGAYSNVNLGLSGYSTNLDPMETSADFGAFATTDSVAFIPLSNTNLNMGAPSGSNADFSVECWINAPPQTTVADATIVSQGINSDNDTFVLACNANGSSTRYLRFYVGGSGHSVTAATSTILPNNTWQHLVGVCNESAGTLTLYINGVSAATATIGSIGLYTAGSSLPIVIGGEQGGSGGFTTSYQWKGQVDDVAIFNYALTAADVAAHYNAKGAPPSITMITSTNVDYGAPVTIAPTSVIGTPPLSYSWFDSNANSVISVRPTLGIPSAASDNYILTVTNGFNPSSTNIVTVIAHQGAPSFSSPGFNISPSSNTVYAGISVTFSVLAYGTYPLSYQWYNGAGIIPGATGTSFTTNTPEGTSTYYCIASNGVSTTASATATLVGVAQPNSLYAQAVLSNNPIAFWRLNEQPDNGSGNSGTIAYDYIGGHNLVYNGVELDQASYNPSDSFAAALFGVYTSPDSYAGETNQSSIGIQPIDLAAQTAEYTVEAWVKASGSQASDAGILAKGYTGNEQFILQSISDEFEFEFHQINNVAVVCQSAVSDTDGNWHHLVGVCDEGGLVSGAGGHFYVDGVDQADAFAVSTGGVEDPGSSAVQDRVSIGARAASNTSTLADQFVGTIADVAIYNYPLSAAQVSAHYNAGIAVQSLTITNLGNGTVQLNWGIGTLQSATSLSGPFSTITNAASPYVVPATNQQQFYRVQE